MGTSESENNDLPKTLVHLLSPEASIRCNHTATHVIVDLEKDLNVSDDSQSLLSGLAEAAYRDRLIVTLWTSPYIKACAFLVGAFHKDHPPVMCIIGSDYACSLKRTQFMDNLLLDILFDHLDHVSPDGHPTPPLVQLFEPDFIVPRNVLRFLEDTHVRLKKPKVSVIISLLMTAKPPAVVLSAVREQAVGGDFLVAERVGFLVVEAVLQLPEQAADWEDVHLLEELCYTCMSIARRAQYHSWHIPGTVNATLVRLPPTSAASAALTRLMAELKESCPRLVFPGVSRPKKQIRLR
ncbi:hypothetical protein B0H17DRAFT_1104271 [Mycena rosella]|uniref:Uncharacterized protein n=1 Tax=Mycena rosella TaxID=1033263 RepID=A0AAD7CD25_MYCRO|nr:hypothetical protein B0H17DRAFT_1104271 [Mycena rosella]